MNRPNEPPMPDPLAYYLTWPTYGTWLPGDERGWVQRGSGRQPPDPVRKREAEAKMTEDACRLDHEQRAVVEKTIAEHCRIRGWELYVVNCRSNHIHVVVAANIKPEAVRSQFKTWCTRKLKELERQRRGNGDVRENWWAERGSRICINDEDGLEAVIQYVRDGQDVAELRHRPDASRPRSSLADWAEQNAERWANRLNAKDVEGFTGRGG
jgi:REP element-mobilizing transposase RayT